MVPHPQSPLADATVIEKVKVATESGKFSERLNLIEGNNTLEVSAISSFGPAMVATVSGIFLPPIEVEGYTLGTTQMIGIGVLILLILAIVGAWWYHKKREMSKSAS